jgi:hypothetical protein
MQLLFGHDATVAKWAGERLGAPYPNATAIGVIDDKGVLRGAILLEAWNAHTLELSLYSEGSIKPSIAKAFFEYVFVACSASRLQVHTERSNKVMRRIIPRAGFRWDGVAKNFYGPGRDALRFYMTPAMCRWIKRHGLQEAA